MPKGERPPGIEVRNFIKYKNIKWAKGRKNANG